MHAWWWVHGSIAGAKRVDTKPIVHKRFFCKNRRDKKTSKREKGTWFHFFFRWRGKTKSNFLLRKGNFLSCGCRECGKGRNPCFVSNEFFLEVSWKFGENRDSNGVKIFPIFFNGLIIWKRRFRQIFRVFRRETRADSQYRASKQTDSHKGPRGVFKEKTCRHESEEKKKIL